MAQGLSAVRKASPREDTGLRGLEEEFARKEDQEEQGWLIGGIKRPERLRNAVGSWGGGLKPSPASRLIPSQWQRNCQKMCFLLGIYLPRSLVIEAPTSLSTSYKP